MKSWDEPIYQPGIRFETSAYIHDILDSKQPEIWSETT